MAGTASPRWALRDVAVTFERGIIALGTGIAVYFAWWTELDWRIVAAVAAVTGLLAAWRGSGWGGLLSLLFCGFAYAAFHTASDSPNPMEWEQRLVVTGQVVAVDRGGPMRRLTIAVARVDPIPRTGVPERVRIRVGRNFPEVRIGDGLRVPAVIAPLPGPAVPHGYDPARRAFYQGLAGSGFAIADPEFTPVDLAWQDRARVKIASVRRRIADRVMERAPEATAGLQAALLTGLRDDIPDEQTEALRASGLAHILAISGLHMGMVSFGVFAFATAALALTPWAASRDMRKPAAVFAMVTAILYLGLSGGSVATQRAFVMVSIALLAVLLDRRALSLRSVAVAALVTLALHPEALMSVGFQMSFAAVTALVVVYREWAERWPRRRQVGFRDRVIAFYGSLAGTSLIAGFATGGFALFHFGRFANYGFFGNLAAMAVFPLVMLCGIIALVVMPLGWDALPLWAMSKGLVFMLGVADWIAGLPRAVGTVPASHPAALALYSAGFVAACFATRRSVMAGVALIAVSLALWVATPQAELRVNADGRVSVRADGAGHTSSLRADRYGREQFARAGGEPEIEWAGYRDAFAACDALACRFQLGEHWISVVEEASEIGAACADSALVVLPEREAGAVSKRGCAAILLDGPALRRMGGAHIETGQTLKVRPVNSARRARRPWGKGERP